MIYLFVLALFTSLSVQAQAPSGLTLFAEEMPPMLEQQEHTVLPQQSVDDLKELQSPQKEHVVHADLASPKEREIERLMKLPAQNLQTNDAPLGDILSLLADACGMSYLGLEGGLGDDVKISVNVNKNPYEILKYIANRYNVAIDYDEDIWHFALYNDDELIARVYNLLYNNQEIVGGGESGGGGESSSSASSSEGSSDEGGEGASLGEAFEVEKDIVKDDIETFLDMSASNPDVMIAEDFDVRNLSKLSDRGVYRVRPSVNTDENSGSGTESSSKVIYNSDNRTLYVVATRAQHQWIEKYLKAVDKPQKQILVETKVYETGLNPQATLGFDWSGSLGSTAFNLNSSQLNTSTNEDGETSTTVGDGLTAILASDQLSATVRFLNSDSNTISVQYPRQVTVSNRTVGIASVEKIPVKKASTETDTSTSSSGTSTSTEVEEISVGTTITILPRIVDENKIHMNIAVKVSSIASYKIIDGNEYPVVSERLYKTEAIVESGYTLAIGGLKETTHGDTYTAVPVLSNIPLVGNLFRQTSKTATDRNLLIFISPYILTEYRGGVKEEPEFILPRTKDTPETRIFEGVGDESYSEVLLSLSSIDNRVQILAQRSREGFNLARLPNEVALLENELNLMDIRLQEIAVEEPNKNISEATKKIYKAREDLHEIRRNISKHRARY